MIVNNALAMRRNHRLGRPNLGLRPIYHQLTRRTAAYLFIPVLVHRLSSAISLTLSESAYTRSISTVLSDVKTHSRLIVMFTDDQALIHHLRISSIPDPAQGRIYEILRVNGPLKRQEKIVAQL